MFEEKPPVTIAVHPDLVEELKLRQKMMFDETGRKTRGGITCFSKQASQELKLIRLSGEQIINELFKSICQPPIGIKKIPIVKFEHFGVVKDFVPYDFFKKLYIFSSLLNKKKDQKQLRVEVFKIKGMNKNDIKYFY